MRDRRSASAELRKIAWQDSIDGGRHLRGGHVGCVRVFDGSDPFGNTIFVMGPVTAAGK